MWDRVFGRIDIDEAVHGSMLSMQIPRFVAVEMVEDLLEVAGGMMH